MLINVFLGQSLNINDLKKIKLEKTQLLQFKENIVWFEGFYIRVMCDGLEINIINPNISEQHILTNIIKPILDGRNALIKIRKGDIVTQFWINKKSAYI